MSLSIGVLGPEGTFSERAAKKWSPQADIIFFDDIEDVLLAVEGGNVELGVVPLENSLEGGVGITLDLLLNSEAKIVGEVNVPIRHCLLGRSESIKMILSHPQALAQCRKYLKQHYPGVELRATGSTTHAAKLAQEFPEMAAIASEKNAELYGLRVLERDIQDGRENVTRFAVVALDAPLPTGRDKTSLVIYLERDRPGALWDILGEFAARGINLTRIESRPSKRELGDYYFYIDLEGHLSDGALQDALFGMEKKAAMVKVLGSYPRA
jgi:prephenate dehydratase